MSHILVIDDEKNTRQQFGELIRSKGFSCYEAINIFEALVYLTLYDFDGIIANIDLPFLNGKEFVQALHSRLRPPFPPIIALSSLENLTPHTRSQLLNSGLTLLVSKPITHQSWKHILNLFTQKTPQAA